MGRSSSAQRLGIKAGFRVGLLHAPENFELGELPEGVELKHQLRAKAYDVIVYFVCRQDELRARFGRLREKLCATGDLWIAWPKNDTEGETDLDEAAVRALGIDQGLVDNKTCAVDSRWSGLRFVHRLRERRRFFAAREGRRTQQSG